MLDPETRILIVDDMATMRKLMAKICNELGFSDVIDAADGAKAWDEIQNASPPIGLVISDLDMPICTGIDLLKRLRSDSRFQTLPFLIVVLASDQARMGEVLKLGADQFITKPFNASMLSDKIEQIKQKRGII